MQRITCTYPFVASIVATQAFIREQLCTCVLTMYKHKNVFSHKCQRANKWCVHAPTCCLSRCNSCSTIAVQCTGVYLRASMLSHRVCSHLLTHTHTCTHTQTFTHTRTHAHACAQSCFSGHVTASASMLVTFHTHVYTQIFTHTFTHTRAHMSATLSFRPHCGLRQHAGLQCWSTQLCGHELCQRYIEDGTAGEQLLEI